MTMTSASSKKRLSAGLKSEAGDEYVPTRRPRRKRRWLLSTLMVLAALVFVAPYVIAYTPLREGMLRWALKDLRGTASCGGASLGWFSPIVFEDFALHDTEGKLVVGVERLESSLPLYGFVTNPTDLGTFKITKPTLDLVASDTTTNLELMLETILSKPKDDSPSTPRDIRLEIVDAAIAIHDVPTGKTWTLDQLAFGMSLRHDAALPVDWAAAGRIPLSDRMASFRVASADAETIQIQSDAIPLEMFRWAAARALGPVELRGFMRAGGTLVNRPVQGGFAQDFRGELAIDQLYVGGPALGTDSLSLASIRVPCDVSASPEVVDVRSLQVICDLGSVSAAGKMPLGVLTAGNVLAILREPSHLDGTIDLAALARQMPRAMNINPQTQITGGQLVAMWDSRKDATATIWNGKLETRNLSATNAGRAISMAEPLLVSVAARDTVNGPVVENLTATARFLKLGGAGNLDQMTVEANCDLDELAAELGQWIDLSTMKPAGQAHAKLVWNKSSDGRFGLTLESTLDRFQLTLPGDLTMREPKLIVGGNVAGTMATNGAARVETGMLTIEAPATAAGGQVDKLLVTLRQAVALAAGADGGLTTALTTTQFPLDFRLQGDLAAWQPRLATFLPLAGYRMAGIADIAGGGQFGADRLRLNALNGKIAPLQFVGAGMTINETEAQLEAAAEVDMAAQRMLLSKLILRTATIAGSVTEGDISWGKAGLTARGNAVYQSDLSRLQLWFADPQVPPSVRTAGILSGNCVIVSQGTTTQLQCNNSIAQLAVYDTKQLQAANGQNVTPIYSEPELKLNLRGKYDTATDLAQFDSLELLSRAIGMAAGGKLNSATGVKPQLELAGKLDYDWDSLAPLMKPYIGDNLAIRGRRSSAFSATGPLDMQADTNKAIVQNVSFSARPLEPDSFAMIKPVSATLALGWDELAVMGIPLARGDLEMQLRDGVFGLQKPFVLNGAEGRITLDPKVRLTPGPMELTLPPGNVVEQFKVTKEMADVGLKYLSPMANEAARVEGRVSLGLSEFRMPVSQWQAMTAAGKATIHGVEVTPGPYSESWVLRVKQVQALMNGALPPTALDKQVVLMRMPEQAIDVRVQDGRVYHQGLVMEVDNVAIRTTGSASLIDNSLSMTIEIPLKPEWIQKYPSLGQLPNQAIRMTMSGTVDKPQISSDEIKQLTTSLLTNVVQDKLLGGAQNKVGEVLGGVQNKVTDQVNGIQGKVDEKVNGVQQKLDGAINKQFNKLFGQ